MEIKAKGTLSKENTKALSHFAIYGRHDPENRLILSFSLIGFALAFLIISLLISFEITASWQILFGWIILLILFQCYLYFIHPKIMYNALGRMKDITNEYVFGESSFTAKASNEHYESKAVVQYSLIYKVGETSTHFFIFQSKNQAYIVEKSTFTNGSVEELKNKLMPLLGKKYILCRY